MRLIFGLTRLALAAGRNALGRLGNKGIQPLNSRGHLLQGAREDPRAALVALGFGLDLCLDGLELVAGSLERR